MAKLVIKKESGFSFLMKTLVAVILMTALALPAFAQQAKKAGAGKQPAMKKGDMASRMRPPLKKVPAYYVIGPSDILEVAVWREDALSRTDVLVRPDGRISMPLLDDVMAAGLTPMQLKLVITKRLKQFVEAPKVYITVANPRSHYFAVIGNAAKPGHFEMLTPTTVLQALSQAGGYNEWADKDETVILRGVGEDQVRIPFEYSEVVSGDKMEQNILLEPGDVILVP